MNPSKESVWGRWLPHPGNLLTQRGSGGMLVAVVGLLLGVPLMSMGIGCLFGAVRTPNVVTAAVELGLGAVVGLIGALFLATAEGALGGSSVDGASRSRPVAALGARAALVLALLVGFALMLARLALDGGRLFYAAGASLFDPGAPRDGWAEALTWSSTSQHSASLHTGMGASFWALIPALLLLGALARYLVRLGTARTRLAVIVWAGTVASLSLVAGLAWGASLLDLYSVRGASTVWRGLLWTLAGSGLTAALALNAQKRLAIWGGADRWRDATVTPELRIVFADGSGDRPASEYFRGYAGPVVVMPTAESAGAVFRGDGAPADGWLVPGTRAALEESVRCVRAMAHLTVAAVGLMAMAPLAVWLVSLVG